MPNQLLTSSAEQNADEDNDRNYNRNSEPNSNSNADANFIRWINITTQRNRISIYITVF